MTTHGERFSARDLASAANRRALGADCVDPLPPALYPGRVPIEGPRVALEPVDPRRHAEELFAIAHAGDEALALWRYLGYGPFNDEGAMHAWLRGCAAASDPVFFALRDKASGGLGGMASFLEIRPLMGVIEMGHIWFAPPLQRTAQATEALFLMMAHAMDYLENRRLEWKCDALNAASRRAALRLGFRFEGVFYNHTIPKGRNRDTAWYSLIDSEWPAVRANIARWLDKANFDARGRPRESLGDLNSALW